MPHWILIACLLVTTWCNAALAVELPLRTWSDRTGRFSVEARLFVQQDEFVTLDAADGRRLDVPLATLSEADQQYLAALVAEQSAPQYGDRHRLTARLGVEVTARDGACRNLMCAFPIPLDWPEQSVTIVDREVSSNVRKVNVHTLGDGVQQVRFLVPRLAAGEVARVVFVLDIERSSILTPRDLSRLRIPTVVDARLRQYVRASPQIEIRHPVVRAEADRLEMRLKESREQHGHELVRIQTLSGVGIETLIAVSGPEQSQLLAQLARTRSLAGCSTEKILAMHAAENPQVAGALKELLIATAASGQLEQYERLVNQLKDSARTSREDYQQNMVVMQQMFDKALDTVKDTAVAFSAAPASTPTREPGLQEHTGPDGTITVCFSEIEGSTATTERLGDQQAQEILHSHNDIIRQIFRAHDGYEVKSMGDGFMLAFSRASSGVQCSIAIQRALAAYNSEHPGEPLRVRIGLHTGEAIKEDQDYFGRNVILASRISSKAQGGEILVSSLVKELAQSSGDIRFSDGLEVELKGLSGLTQVHLVDWT